MKVLKQKRHNLVATTALSLSLAVTSLGVPRANAADFDWKQAQGSTINISFNQHPYADAIIQQLPKFKEQTGIDVKYELTPEENYFDKVTTQLSAGTGVPDVFMTGVYQMWDYASAKRLEPLDAMLSDAALTSPDYNAKDIFEGVFNAGKWDLKPGSPPGSGSLWCLPLGFELYSLAYNKKYFDEKGIKVPTTLDELSELAVKLKDWNGPGSYGVAVRGTRNWATIHPGYMSSFKAAGAKDFVIENGKLMSALGAPEAVAITAKFADMIRKGGPPGWSNYTWYQCGADLGAGKAAILYDADINGYFQNVPGSTSQSGNIGFAPPPVSKAGEDPVSNEWVWQLAMNSTSKNKKAAWLFMQYFTGPEFTLWAALNAKTVDPARQSVWDNQEFKDKIGKVPGYYDTFTKTIPKTAIQFTPQPYFIQSTTEWAATLQKIVLSGADPKQAMEALAKKISRDTSKLKLD
jgi:multiple sugar transport system substrate-binding protein